MLAVLFRGIENFKMFDHVNLLTNGGPVRSRDRCPSRSSVPRSRNGRLADRPRWHHSVSDRVLSRPTSTSRLSTGVERSDDRQIYRDSVVEAFAVSRALYGYGRVLYCPDHHNAAVVEFLTSFKTPSDSVLIRRRSSRSRRLKLLQPVYI